MFRRDFIQLATLPFLSNILGIKDTECHDLNRECDFIKYHQIKVIDYGDHSLDQITGDRIDRRMLETDRFDPMYVATAHVLPFGTLAVYRFTDGTTSWFEKMTFHEDWKVIQYDASAKPVKILTKKDYLKTKMAVETRA